MAVMQLFLVSCIVRHKGSTTRRVSEDEETSSETRQESVRSRCRGGSNSARGRKGKKGGDPCRRVCVFINTVMVRNGRSTSLTSITEPSSTHEQSIQGPLNLGFQRRFSTSLSGITNSGYNDLTKPRVTVSDCNILAPRQPCSTRQPLRVINRSYPPLFTAFRHSPRVEPEL